MPKYFTIRSEYWEEPPTLGTTITIHEPDKTPIKTGLVDKDGNDIFKAHDCVKLGFDTSPKKKHTR